MNEKGGPIIMVALLFVLFWICSEAPKKIEPIPVDGLVEVVATVEESLAVEPSNNPGEFDHIPDAGQKVDPQPSSSDKPKAKREIIIFTRPNCPPCDQWKGCEQAKFEADGWVVAYCSEHNFAHTPTFVIERNGRSAEYRGYLPFAKIDEVAK